jgi:hypothetical protein
VGQEVIEAEAPPALQRGPGRQKLAPDRSRQGAPPRWPRAPRSKPPAPGCANRLVSLTE